MPRGQASPLGETRTAANGYHYTKAVDPRTGESKWRLTHHITAETKILGRPLAADERVIFKGSKRDYSNPDNLIIVAKGKYQARKRLAVIEARLEELEAERQLLLQELGIPDHKALESKQEETVS